MLKILIATKNPGKLKDMKKYMADEHFELIPLDRFKNVPDVEENGITMYENALKKATIYHSLFKLPAVSDDAVVEIDTLGGEPGVRTRRWPGHEATDDELIEMTLEKLHGVPWDERKAHMRAVGVFYDGQHVLTAIASIEGYIIDRKPEHCEPGYPFRSLLWIPQFNKLYGDLTPEEYEQISHRKKVYTKLRRDILALYGLDK